MDRALPDFFGRGVGSFLVPAPVAATVAAGAPRVDSTRARLHVGIRLRPGDDRPGPGLPRLHRLAPARGINFPTGSCSRWWQRCLSRRSRETIFRGFLLSELARSAGRCWGNAIAALIFALAHFLKIPETFDHQPVHLWSGATAIGAAFLNVSGGDFFRRPRSQPVSDRLDPGGDFPARRVASGSMPGCTAAGF